MLFRFLLLFFTSTLFTPSAFAGSPRNSSLLKIAVVDTGCDFDHPLLESFVRIPTLADGQDETGHGTHIAGIIINDLKLKGFASGFEIVPIKFFDKEDNDTELTHSFAHALRRAIDQKVNIIHLSAGGPQANDEEWRLLVEAQQKGILVVAAAGNKKPSSTPFAFYPAAYNLSHVLSVVGTDDLGKTLKTSNINRGKNNLLFPGKNIQSALPGNRYGPLTGSSQAAAKATAAIAALWMEKGKKQALSHYTRQPIFQAKHP